MLSVLCYLHVSERDERSMSGRDRNRGGDGGPDKTDSDWRARPSSDTDNGPWRDDGFGERKYTCRQHTVKNISLDMLRKKTPTSQPPPGPLQARATDTSQIDSVMGHGEMLIAMTVAETDIGNVTMTVTAGTMTEV